MGEIRRLSRIASGICASLMVLLCPFAASGQDGDLMLTNYIGALNANMPPNMDAEAVSMLMTEDFVHRHPFTEPEQAPMIGREAAREFFAGFDNSFADWTHVESFRMVDGIQAVWEGVVQGTHKETGKPVSLPIVFFLTFDDDGLLAEARTYVDVHMIAQQLE